MDQKIVFAGGENIQTGPSRWSLPSWILCRFQINRTLSSPEEMLVISFNSKEIGKGGGEGERASKIILSIKVIHQTAI